MKRLLGILVIIAILYGALLQTSASARSPENQRNIAKNMGFYGVMTLGVGILIIAGGIDLSIGAVVGLSAVGFGVLRERGWDPYLTAALVLGLAPFIGLFHGLLVTKLKLQPFIVTLCGLFIYRGLALLATVTEGASAKSVGVGNRDEIQFFRFLATGQWQGLPMMFVIALGLGLILAIFLHMTVPGRYIFAVGSNEQAARYAGVNSDRYKILAYMICSFLAGLAGILELFNTQTAQPTSTGNWYELYAITGAVLGGCSLRGGEGTVAGMLLGATILPLLRNLVQLQGIPDEYQYTFIGVALLIGTIADELLKGSDGRKRT